jgi:hypothetical protein
MAKELVAGNHRGFNVLWLSASSPKRLGADKCFNIARANAAGFYLNNDLIRMVSGMVDGGVVDLVVFSGASSIATGLMTEFSFQMGYLQSMKVAGSEPP